ncbi:50S ribosomal protein L3 [bacterium]|nr:50S ribosomal protein L3 [bacterium]
MSVVLLGKKIGMTKVFDDKGEMIPVSVIEINTGTVLAKKTKKTDGYEALQIGFGKIKVNKVNKPMSGYFAKIGLEPKRYIKESRTDAKTLEQYNVGDQLNASFFTKGEYVDVSAKSKGKGFAGVIKRWNFHGGRKTHGSMFHRSPGAIGAAADPARVFKGTKLPGRMGGIRSTVQNIIVVDVREQENVILVRGSIPGFNSAVVQVRKAIKKQ